MKKFIKLFSVVMFLAVIICNFSFATSFSDVAGDAVTVNGINLPVTSEQAQDVTEKVGEEVSNWALTIMGVVSSVSLPICALLCLWGAVLYFIMGIRNLYKKRQGMLLMWGSFTFLVVAKVAYFIVWFIAR